MARNNNSTEAQRRYIESLAKNLTDEQFSQAIRKTGSASDKAHDHRATRNQRLSHLTKAYASTLIELLRDEEYVNSLIATDEHEDEENQQMQDFTARFEEGVSYEDAKNTLREYLDAGAEAMIEWDREGQTYIAKLLVSWPEDLEDCDSLGFVFGNQDLDDMSAFDDGKNGDRADESEPYTRCENELLDRFGITREDIVYIHMPW